jgi:hypothetical protein
MRIRAVYKIVRVDGDAYASISFSEGDAAYVRYEPGQWARAPEAMRRLGYDLCVFRDLTYVATFRGPVRRAEMEVWRCDAQDVWEPTLPSLDVRSVDMYVRAALDGRPLDIETLPYGAWPPGTLFARAVRLVKQVPWDHELLR